MSAYFQPMSLQSILGAPGVDAAGEPLLTLGENLNWLYLHHTPALSAWSGAIYSSGTPGTSVRQVVGVTPSADSLLYALEVGIRTATGGALEVDLDTSTLAAPDPDDAADWTPVSTFIAGTVAADGTGLTASNWLGVIDEIILAPTVTHIRVTARMTGGGQTVSITGGLLYPAPLTMPTVLALSGFTPFNAGHLPNGGPVHTELLNRLWASAGAVLRDRRQCAWSYVADNGEDFALVASRPRVIAIGPACLPGQAGATLQLAMLASSVSSPVTVRVSELRGGGSAELVLTGSASITDYVRVAGTITITTDDPILVVTAVGSTARFRPVYIIATWRPGD